MSDKEPRRISATIHDVEITGNLCPMKDETQPITVQGEGSDAVFVPVFTTLEKLRITMKSVFYLSYHKISQIRNGEDFLTSLEKQNIRVMIDPYRHANGRIRFIEAVSDSSDLIGYQ